jgi:hypothetical protein
MRDSGEHGSVIGGSAPPTRIAYRIRDAADQIGLSEREMWRLVKDGQIASFKYGEFRNSPRRISHEALVAYVQSKQRQSAAAPAA